MIQSHKLVQSALAAHWDNMAEEFCQFEIPDKSKDALTRLLDEEGILKDCATALDIGCGAGRYSIALAQDIAVVHGFDISPKMVAYARENALKHQVDNVWFDASNWDVDTLDQKEFKPQYDLVFAHMTPAIHTKEDFRKMMSTAAKWGVLTMHVRRHDSILDDLEKTLYGKQRLNQRDDQLLTYFAMLWQEGYNPKLHYESLTWENTRSYDKACTYYLGRLKTAYAVTQAEEKTVKTYLKQMAAKGRLTETITSTAVTLYWKKKE